MLLLLLKNEPRIETVTISGMGTGVGKVPYNVCAKQMRQAYDDIWLGKYIFPPTLLNAQMQHSIYSDK